MNIYELMVNNQKASDYVKFSPKEKIIDDPHKRNSYRGFVNCIAADGEDAFLMFTNADDVVAGYYFYDGPASFEHGTLKLWAFLVKQSAFVFDIGAFTGVFSLAAVTANPNCRVMAFEPSFVTYSRLLVNIYANGFNGHIAPVRFGVADKNGELALRHPAGVYVMASGESFLDSHISDPWFTENVPVVSLDHLLENQERYKKQLVIEANFSRVDLMKIDVEGFEANVLKGMQSTIQKHKPTAIVEILDRYKVQEILELFGENYKVFHINESNGTLSEEPIGTNKLFIHNDKLGLLAGYR